MYMANPQRILGTFMVRHEGYRVRIDDVQHNIGGYYLFWKNYDRLTAYGLRSAPADPRPAPCRPAGARQHTSVPVSMPSRNAGLWNLSIIARSDRMGAVSRLSLWQTR